MSEICEFRGENYYLSNFYETPVTYEGVTYQNIHWPLGTPRGLIRGTRKGTLNQFCAGGDAASVSRAMIRMHRV